MERQQHSVTEMLNENNYGSWSINMENYLVARGLLGAVTGEDGSNEDGWARRNAAALRAIRVNCSAEIFERIGDVSTAKYAWDALINMFGFKNKSGLRPSYRAASDRELSGDPSSEEEEIEMKEEAQMQPPITEKLNGDANYRTWRANMTNYLEAEGLWEVVTGEELLEQDGTTTILSLEWMEKDDAALRAIKNNCSEKISEMIDYDATSKHAWAAFLTLFSREEEIIEPESVKFGPSNQEKLNEENFRIWRGNMKIQLEAEGVWDVVTGKIMRGEDTAGEWTIKNATALCAIRINCGETILPIINDVYIAEHAWKTLLKRFRPSPLRIPEESGLDNQARSNHDPIEMDELMRYIGSEDMTKLAGKGMNGNEVIIRENGYTALHVAVSARKLAVVECFLGNESIRAPMVDKKKRTALALAAYHGKLEIVKKLVHKYPTWLFIKDNRGNIPLVAACEGGHVDTTRFLYKQTFKYLSEARAVQVYEEDYESTQLIRQYDDTEYCIVSKCLESKMLGIALEVLRHNKKTVLFNSSSAPLLMLAEKPKAFWKRRAYKGIHKIYTHDDCALEILKIMCQQISPLNDIDLGKSDASGAMFAAVKNGNLEFVIEIIKINPCMRWMLNDNNRDLLTCSIENRQENIANFLYGLEESTDAVVRFGGDKSNLLHVAAKIASDFQLSRVSGAALQMQRELKWFKEVESIVPDYFKESTNERTQTPSDIFTKEHEKLLEEAEKWMKDTASYYSIVGALIITMMFATAFTVPGGNDQNGVPLFRHKVLFKIFIILATTSFSAASTSVMVFLGILTSRYAEQDFLVSLPRKLMVGMFTLFISMTVMMAAYSVAIVLMFEGKHWTIIVMVILGSIPVLCFAREHLPLLKEIFVSTQWRVFNKKRTPYTWPRARSSSNEPRAAETASTNNNEAPAAETVVEISTL